MAAELRPQGDAGRGTSIDSANPRDRIAAFANVPGKLGHADPSDSADLHVFHPEPRSHGTAGQNYMRLTITLGAH